MAIKFFLIQISMSGDLKSGSNSSKSDSNSSCNSGNKKSLIETMDCLEENNNTMINRVWIVKKSISFGDISNLFRSCATPFSQQKNMERASAFKIKKETKWHFKHWATILELSNGTYVNIQFGTEGFSLKEFNKTNIDGESVLDSILQTWGFTDHPFSFCYLGNANYEYKKLKERLKTIKDEELKCFKEKGSVYYNLIHRNCQHFACDIEKILFGAIKVWHSFDYYIEEFFLKFFTNIDINKWK